MDNFILFYLSPGFSGDYNLKFPSGSISYVIYPNILTEFKAFSLCLWIRCRTYDDWKIALLRYSAKNGNFTIRYNSPVKKVQTTLWSRYDFQLLYR